MSKIDLHLHSNCSDGIYSPKELIKIAKDNNCKMIAITDHDYLEDYSEYEDYFNIKIINGIEFNSTVPNMHLLGLNIKDVEMIKNEINAINQYNSNVALELLKLLNKNGIQITYGEVKKYIESLNLNFDSLNKRKIVKYLIYKGYCNSVLEAYDKLIGQNAPYYIPNYKLTPEEIIKLINASGGKSILAHPKTLNLDSEELKNEIKLLINYGLMGIEVLNKNKFNKNDTRLFERIANNNYLIKTYGSDFHNQEDLIGVEINDYCYDELVKKLIR